jgi:hypothetical protein
MRLNHSSAFVISPSSRLLLAFVKKWLTKEGTRKIRKQIAVWRKRNPDGDISQLESIDELPEPDEPVDP